MKWIKGGNETKIPIKSWCEEVEPQALKQAYNLANHPAIAHHVALMPDCHVGYGMPIGGVIAVKDALIPNAVGVDIGCGMVAVETDLPAERFLEMPERRAFMERVKARTPVGEGRSHGPAKSGRVRAVLRRAPRGRREVAERASTARTSARWAAGTTSSSCRSRTRASSG
jgi:tRNA-splicing ligase RtcB